MSMTQLVGLHQDSSMQWQLPQDIDRCPGHHGGACWAANHIFNLMIGIGHFYQGGFGLAGWLAYCKQAK